MRQEEQEIVIGQRLSREDINACPVRKYEGPVHIVRDAEACRQACVVLSRERVLGFDTETRPSFARGDAFPPALVQLAGCAAVYLFQLKFLPSLDMLRTILASPDIIKAGIATGHDVRQLKQLGDFCAAAFVNLDDVARKAGIKNHGLRGLCAAVLGFRVSKQAKLSNWARSRLSPEQIVYAATDAWASRELYLHLEKSAGFENLIREELQPGAGFSDACRSASDDLRRTARWQR
jgi:ribonuclease D